MPDALEVELEDAVALKVVLRIEVLGEELGVVRLVVVVEELEVILLVALEADNE